MNEDNAMRAAMNICHDLHEGHIPGCGKELSLADTQKAREHIAEIIRKTIGVGQVGQSMSPALISNLTKLINANAFASLSRDAGIVHKVRNQLIRLGVIKQTDKPYVGCVKINKQKEQS